MPALAPLPEVGGHSYLDDRWFNRYRWSTLPLFFTIPSEAAEGYLDLHDEFHDADKCWLRTSNDPCSRSQSHWCWRVPILLRHLTKREFGALYPWQRSSWSRVVARASLSMRPSIMEAGFARKLIWGLFAVQQNYSQNMAVDARSVILLCSAYDSLSHATLRHLLPRNCACEYSHKRYSNTLT